MEHPLIGNIDHLTEDELSMAIESFQGKYQQKLQEARKGQSTNFDDKIDIK